MPDTTTPPVAPATAPPAAPAAPAGGAAPPAAPAQSALEQAASVKPAAPAEGAKPPEGAKPAEGAKPGEVKPLVAPKGFESMNEAFAAHVKELGLEGDKAQKYVDSIAAIDTQRTKALDTQAEAQEAKWLEESKADPTIGGAKWDESMKSVNRALSKFGGPMVKVGDREVPQLAVLFAKAGLGNNKHVLTAFALVGNALKDDSIAGTEKPAPKTPASMTDAEKLYGAHNNPK